MRKRVMEKEKGKKKPDRTTYFTVKSRNAVLKGKRREKGLKKENVIVLRHYIEPAVGEKGLQDQQSV